MEIVLSVDEVSDIIRKHLSENYLNYESPEASVLFCDRNGNAMSGIEEIKVEI
ncbi:hypothetical protein D3C74_339950 [compost metagenome]